MKKIISKYGAERILIFTLIFISIFYLKSCFDILDEKNNLGKAIEKYEQKPKVIKDDSGRLHSIVVENQIDRTQLEAFYKHQIDSISKLLKIKEKKLNSVLSANFTTNNSGFGQLNPDDSDLFVEKHDTIIKVDSFPTISNLKVNDGHLEFNAKIFKDKSFKWNYTYKDSLNVVNYSKKTGLFGLGKTENYIDVSMSNKNSEIIGIRQFKIKEKEKKFSVGPYAGMSFNGTKIFPAIGVGVQFSLFKF